MRYAIATAIGVAAIASTAHAQINALFPGQVSSSAATAERYSLSEGSVGISLDGKKIQNLAGHSSNPLYQVELGLDSRVTGLDWSLNLDASSPVYISDLKILAYTLDSVGEVTQGVLIGPGEGINFSGKLRVNDEWLGLSNESGVIDLASLGLDFGAGADGSVYIEFYSEYKGDTITMMSDSTFRLITTSVPTPGSALALGGLVVMRRRRRG